jgi:hypothetical protein
MAIYSLSAMPRFSRPLHGFAVTDRDTVRKADLLTDSLYRRGKELGGFVIQAEILARIL